jgi:glycosyltransferase involved in cell wall biosynthesis
MPLVSVIITTRNRCEILGRAVESVLAQTFKDYELIVVDDASTDGTPEVLGGYRGVSRVVRVEASRGANHARNLGLSQATGRLVAYLDDDDRWLPRKLERQVAAFEEIPDAVLVGCRFRIDGKVRKIPEEIGYERLLKGNLLGGFSMCAFPRKLVEKTGGMDESLRNAQDWDLWLKLARYGRTVCVPECLVDYSTSQPDRISAKRDGQVHYGNYQRVVDRHRDEMGPWTRSKHRLVVGYHTTSPAHRIRKFGLGILYLAFRTADQLVERI